MKKLKDLLFNENDGMIEYLNESYKGITELRKKLENKTTTKAKSLKELILESRPVKGSRSGLEISDEIIGIQLGHNIHKPQAVKDREEVEAAAEAERKARRSKYNKTAYKNKKEKNRIAQAIRSKNLDDLKTADANWRNNATKALERDDKIVLTKPVEKNKKVISTKVRGIF